MGIATAVVGRREAVAAGLAEHPHRFAGALVDVLPVTQMKSGFAE